MKVTGPDICCSGGDAMPISYNISKALVPKFVETVNADLDSGIETLGMVFGTRKSDESIKVSTILIPNQTQTKNSCVQSDPKANEQIVSFCVQNPKAVLTGKIFSFFFASNALRKDKHMLRKKHSLLLCHNRHNPYTSNSNQLFIID